MLRAIGEAVARYAAFSGQWLKRVQVCHYRSPPLPPFGTGRVSLGLEELIVALVLAVPRRVGSAGTVWGTITGPAPLVMHGI